jgi:uncharacterized protein (DUF305 family)
MLFVSGYVVGSLVSGDQDGVPAAAVEDERTPVVEAELDADATLAAMLQTMRVDSEADFLQQSVRLEEEAIAAARLLRARTERGELRDYADHVIRSQGDEVRQLQAWRDRWHASAQPPDDYVPLVRSDLDELDGAELDEAYLRDMTVHHLLAIELSQSYLAGEWFRHQPPTELAKSIIGTRRSELFQLRRWLEEA